MGFLKRAKKRLAPAGVLATGLLTGLGIACTGTGDRTMSAAEHESEAAADDERGVRHEGLFDPAAARRGCFRGAGRRAERSSICWTSVRNPTAVHLSVADAYRRRAAAHKNASAALRDAEATACTGIAPDDRDMTPFAHAEDILSVRAVRRPRQIPGRSYLGTQLVGAVVTFRAVEG